MAGAHQGANGATQPLGKQCESASGLGQSEVQVSGVSQLLLERSLESGCELFFF